MTDTLYCKKNVNFRALQSHSQVKKNLPKYCNFAVNISLHRIVLVISKFRWNISARKKKKKFIKNWKLTKTLGSYLIKLNVSLYMVNAAFSVTVSFSMASPVSRKYKTASRYNIACARWSVSLSAACFSVFASDRNLLWSLEKFDCDCGNREIIKRAPYLECDAISSFCSKYE